MPLVMKTRKEAPKREAFLHFFAPLVEFGIFGGCWDGVVAGRPARAGRGRGGRSGTGAWAARLARAGRTTRYAGTQGDRRHSRAFSRPRQTGLIAHRLAAARLPPLGIAGAARGRQVDARRARSSPRSATPRGWCRWTASTSRSRELVRLGRRDRMGAPDTFDAAGYAALLRAAARATSAVVYAPEFRREIEEPIAGAIAVAARRPARRHRGQLPAARRRRLGAVRPLLDEAWYVEIDEDRASSG